MEFAHSERANLGLNVHSTHIVVYLDLFWFSLMVNSHVLKDSETDTTSLQGINVTFFGENWLLKLMTYKCCNFIFVVIFALFTQFLCGQNGEPQICWHFASM